MKADYEVTFEAPHIIRLEEDQFQIGNQANS